MSARNSDLRKTTRRSQAKSRTGIRDSLKEEPKEQKAVPGRSTRLSSTGNSGRKSTAVGKTTRRMSGSPRSSIAAAKPASKDNGKYIFLLLALIVIGLIALLVVKNMNAAPKPKRVADTAKTTREEQPSGPRTKFDFDVSDKKYDDGEKIVLDEGQAMRMLAQAQELFNQGASTNDLHQRNVCYQKVKDLCHKIVRSDLPDNYKVKASKLIISATKHETVE